MKKKSSQTEDFPPAARELLNPFQLGKLDRTIARASEARRIEYELAHKVPYTHDELDFEREVAFSTANFNYSHLVISTMIGELRAAGVRGERLREVMKPEISDAVISGDLGVFYEKQIYDLLIENDSDGDL
jgi:hypothetical protein